MNIINLLESIEPIKFLNFNLGKFAFLGIILFLIIYLIKPKPKNRVIPSLMFIVGKRRKGKINSFFRKIVSDPLFLLQLLTLVILCFAALEPIYEYKHDLTSDKTVIVIDTSASMNAKGRMSEAKSIAKDKVSGLTSLVGIEKNPKTYFVDYDEKSAKEEIGTIKATASLSNILAGIKTADRILGNSTGKIIIISDFVDTENDFIELNNYKKNLEGKGRNVEFVILPNLKNNVGIIDSSYKNNILTLKVKNYNDEPVTVHVKEGRNEVKLEIDKNSIEKVQIELQKGLSEIKIKEEDDFMLDNKFYINVPTKRELNVLVITNTDYKNTKDDNRDFLFDFLDSASNINYDVSVPPKIPKMDYDAVILYKIENGFLLQKIIDDLKIYIENGGGVIIHKHSGKVEAKLGELLPVTILGIQDYGTPDYVSESLLTKDLSFGEVNKYYKTKLTSRAESLVSIKLDSIISYKNTGLGKVLYLGISEQDNDFKVSASYPIFLSRAITFVSEFNNFEDLNRVSEEVGYENEVGFITKGQKNYAVNLVNERESNIILSKDEEENITRLLENIGEMTFTTEQFNLNLILAPIIILLLIYEIYFIKRRGDL